MNKRIIATTLIASLICASIFATGCKNGTGNTSETTAADTKAETKFETTIPETTAEETTVEETTAEETTFEETTVPETVPETIPEPVPETEPYVAPPDPNYIENVYTREYMNSLDRTVHGYGQGYNVDEYNRPYGATNAQNAYGAYNTAFIAPADGNIYLTFDLGYENGYTSTILDTLAAKGVKAVFFVTMQYCRSQPAIVQRIINEGHVLGNHSVNHYSMPTLSIDQMEYEILELHNYILNTYGYEMFLFRPPMGEFSTQSLAVTQNLGYKTVHWSFAYLDYDTANQPEYYAALDRVTGAAHSGAIYLLHAVSATNTAILGDVIDSFRNQGYTIGLFK